MQLKIKLFAFSLVIVSGLLLGGNVSADGAAVSSSKSETISAQIDQIKQKIDALTAQLEAQKSSPAGAVKKTQLTQAQLDRIESEIKRIAKETARLKVEVGVFVTLREIQRKTAELAIKIAAERSGISPQTSTAAVLNQTQPSTDAKRQEVEAQVAKIKQQIAELTQEMEAKDSVPSSQTAAAAEEIKTEECPGGNCSLEAAGNSAQQITINPAPESEKDAQTEKNGGFWQSVGNFLKKIFTF